MNIVQIIREETREHRDRSALSQGGREVTYEDLLGETERFAGYLRSLPFKTYSRVGVLFPEGMDYVLLNLAVLSLQAVVVPIPQSSSEEEIEIILSRMKLDALIFETSLYSAGDKAFESETPFQRRPLKVVFFNPAMKEQTEFEALNPAFIRFTSGTTGESKGVVLSHETILARTDAADQALRITREDTVLWVLSMSYHFIVTTLLFLRRGAKIVLCRQEIPRGLIEGLKTERVTFMYASPLHYQAMTASPEVLPAQCSAVRMAVSTTAQLSARIAGSFAEKFGFELSAAYGIIEIGLPFINRSPLPGRREAAGTLLPGYECRLSGVDEKGTGVVNLRGPGLFDAYFSPWEPRTNGWFKTGDLGRFDEEGFLYLLGREQQVISFMGMKIFPQEIEAALLEHDGVREAFVYGAAHETFGQIPQARIVLKNDYAAVDEESLRRFCYERLSQYKVPKKFEFVQALKKTASGKVRVNQ